MLIVYVRTPCFSVGYDGCHRRRLGGIRLLKIRQGLVPAVDHGGTIILCLNLGQVHIMIHACCLGFQCKMRHGNEMAIVFDKCGCPANLVNTRRECGFGIAVDVVRLRG